MAHRVTAPLVITKNENGSDLYLYEGAYLPSHVKPAEIKRLADMGLIDAPDDESAADSADAESDAAPAKSASKADWVAYAVSQGATQDEAEGSTKEELVSTYGS